MSVTDYNAGLEQLKDSLAAKLTTRHVQRVLPHDPMGLPREQLLAGVLCVVSEGGGEFANYYGREGDLGVGKVALVGFLQVAEDTEPDAIEIAELALLNELLNWCQDPGAVPPPSQALPMDWAQSRQLEHPYGWVLLHLDLRP